MADDEILIVIEESEDPSGSGQKGWRNDIQERLARLREVRLPVSQLEENMSRFLQMVGRLFKQVDQEIGADSALRLDEVELSVEIGGEGEVKLVAGGKATGKGAIKLKFKRADSK